MRFSLLVMLIRFVGAIIDEMVFNLLHKLLHKLFNRLGWSIFK